MCTTRLSTDAQRRLLFWTAYDILCTQSGHRVGGVCCAFYLLKEHTRAFVQRWKIKHTLYIEQQQRHCVKCCAIVHCGRRPSSSSPSLPCIIITHLQISAKAQKLGEAFLFFCLSYLGFFHSLFYVLAQFFKWCRNVDSRRKTKRKRRVHCCFGCFGRSNPVQRWHTAELQLLAQKTSQRAVRHNS